LAFKTRLLLTTILSAVVSWSLAQSRQISLGIFTGLTVPFTLDEGVNKDSRYLARYEVKAAPIGIAYGVDYQGYGFVINPSLIRIGQNYHVINTVGGQEGLREINMEYLNIPIGLKLHVIDMSFFKVSLIGGISAAFLLNGKETITHEGAKFRFPSEVYPILPAIYKVEYDGVLAPKVDNFRMLEKQDFNKFQMFTSFGFRSDWDISGSWRASLDVRVNYGITETRTDTYLQKLSTYQTLYDIAGRRREMFVYLNLGIARFIEIDRAKEHKTKSVKKFTPKKYPWVAPGRKKPKA
jgi:hypothetical protein